MIPTVGQRGPQEIAIPQEVAKGVVQQPSVRKATQVSRHLRERTPQKALVATRTRSISTSEIQSPVATGRMRSCKLRFTAQVLLDKVLTQLRIPLDGKGRTGRGLHARVLS
jgi:hypothetical protein